MKHIRTLSKTPMHATDIPTSYKIDFFVALLDAIKPILQVKEGATAGDTA